MVKIVIGLVIISLSSYVEILRQDLSKQRDRRLELANYTYQTACYMGAIQQCGHFKWITREECYQDAIDTCPSKAIQFVEWLKNNKK